MKLFWLLVAALVVAGGAFLFLSKPQESGARGGAQTQQAEVTREAGAQPKSDAIAKFEGEAVPRPEILPNVSVVPKQQEGAAVDASKVAGAEQTGAAAATGAASTQAATNVAANVAANAAGGVKTAAGTQASAQHGAGHNPDAKSAAPEGVDVAGAKTGKLSDYEIEPGEIKPQADGTTLVDGRFTLKGDGTAANPYRVPWEYLVSVNEVFDPSKGLGKMPERIKLLEGKHVRLTGYVAFPLMVQRPRELLSMLNQWDGCCIGVPPTPFDAVEVKLKKAVGTKERYANAGQVEGVFTTEPYVVKNWVVGMFVLSDASFTPVDTGEEAEGDGGAAGGIVN